MRNPVHGRSSSLEMRGIETRERGPSQADPSWWLQFLHLCLLTGTSHLHHDVYDEISRSCGLRPDAGRAGHGSGAHG